VMRKLNQLQREIARSGGSGFGFGVNRNQAARQRDYLRQALVENGCDIPVLGFGWGGGYKTLCVRTCDGYYFPLSFSASRGKFKIDEAVCKAMYGGAEAELYLQSNAGSAEQAVSLKGQPLAAQPFAFQYRTTFNSACALELHNGLRRIAAAAIARAEEL